MAKVTRTPVTHKPAMQAAPAAPVAAPAAAPATAAPAAVAPAAPQAPMAQQFAAQVAAQAAATQGATAPANGAPGTPPAPYMPRRYPGTTVLALGPQAGKPGTVAHWFRAQLAATLAALGTPTCTMAQYVETVTANYAGLCAVSRAAPVRGQQLYAFTSGYLRWQARHGQITVQG